MTESTPNDCTRCGRAPGIWRDRQLSERQFYVCDDCMGIILARRSDGEQAPQEQGPFEQTMQETKV